MKNTLQKTISVIGLASIFLSGMALSAGAQALTRDQVGAWLEDYEEAWETRDADKVTALFTDDATYQEEPYADPFEGREGIHEYWTTVTSDQQDVEFTYEILAVSGNTGIAHWRTEFTQKSSGSAVVLDGIFVLTFSAVGLCRNLKEWWHIQVTPPEENQ